MFSLEEVMQYEPVSDNMSWTEFKQTKLYQLYYKNSMSKDLANIKANVDAVMQGRISFDKVY